VTTFSQKSDRDLVLACQRREPAAFEELVKRHQKAVYCLLYQLAPDWTDIAELSQQVFIRVWRNINNLRNPASFRPWLTQVIINLFFEEQKARTRRVPLRKIEDEQAKAESETANGEEAEQPVDENHLNPSDPQLLRQALIKLPEQFRTSLVLREMEGLNYEEIAVLTKTEVGTVKSRIAQARSLLQQMLEPRLDRELQTGVVG
jgi:RNA polymerase sigma-70 factor, ECF subfamily